MSAIIETEPGGEMVCILSFSSRPVDDRNKHIPGEWREFHVGERVRYVSHFFKDTPADNPTGYMAVFAPLDPHDPNRYAAVETYFVSLDCWEGLKSYFSRSLAVRGVDIVLEEAGDSQGTLIKLRAGRPDGGRRKQVEAQANGGRRTSRGKSGKPVKGGSR
jgi:hypothetical protein